MSYLIDKIKKLLSNRDNIIIMPVICGALYALGGGGFLALRRYAMPLFMALSMIWLAQYKLKDIFKSLVSAAAVSFPLHFGYGQEIAEGNVLRLALIGLYIAAGTLGFWLFYSRTRLALLLRLLIPVVFIWGVAMCNDWIGYGWTMEWKVAEALMGVAIGSMVLIDVWGRWR